MIFPSVTELLSRPEPVTRDTFIDDATPLSAHGDRSAAPHSRRRTARALG
jgi:hypothetical protein